MSKGKMWVVGIGPGSYEDLTIRAVKALENSEYIAGYTVYCELMRPFFPNKEYISTAMMGEEKRVELALSTAAGGHKVSLICSGDAGVYGLAGLALQMAGDFNNVEIEVIPGITAALSGAALLGAPLIHDFCLISLSDRLTPMETIERRLRSAAEADMGIVIYNPESKSRHGYLAHACDILLEKIDENRICGIVKNIGRDGESLVIMTLKELKNAEADMFSTIFIGNSSAKRCGDHIVTARGYGCEK